MIVKKSFWFFIFPLIFLSLWWAYLHLSGLVFTDQAYWFNISYGIIGLIGGINGLFISKKWGGLNSLVGKAIIFLSFGLIMEWLAVTIWSIYNIWYKVEIPYPSLADIFYFMIIPLYSIAMIFLAKASGAIVSLKELKNKLNAIFVPSLMLLFAYYLFLKQGIDTANPVKLIFDLGYPLGYAITLSIGIITLFTTKNYLGGQMKKIVIFLLIAYFIQFITDYCFLYTVGQETYYNANWVDLFYSVALASMSLAILQFGEVVDKISSNEKLK